MDVGWSCWTWVTTGYKPYHYDLDEAKNPFRLNNTSILCIYKVFKHLPMQWLANMDASLLHHTLGGVSSWLNLGNKCIQTIPIWHSWVQEPLQTELHIYLIYIWSFEAPSNAVDGHMDASVGHLSHGGGLSWLNQGNNWVRTLPLCQERGQEPLQTEWNFYLIYV